jgi:hypothetical protein
VLALLLGVLSSGGVFEDSRVTAATGDQIFGYLFHPTGDSASQSKLVCGWHDNCDGNFNDLAKKGLDWHWFTQSTDTWIRLKFRGTTSSEYVAKGRSYNQTFKRLPGVFIDITRLSDSALFGQVRQNHSSVGTVSYYQWVGGPDTQNEFKIGKLLDPAKDPCSSFWHVMQWYRSGPNDIDSLISKNTNIPNESECNFWAGCAIGYDRWSSVEYIFGFVQ